MDKHGLSTRQMAGLAHDIGHPLLSPNSKSDTGLTLGQTKEEMTKRTGADIKEQTLILIPQLDEKLKEIEAGRKHLDDLKAQFVAGAEENKMENIPAAVLAGHDHINLA